MIELKNLTTEQLMKVYAEINKELCDRRNKKRENNYKKLINATKEFQETEFFGLDSCSFTAYCEEYEDEVRIDFFEYFDSIIEELERGM